MTFVRTLQTAALVVLAIGITSACGKAEAPTPAPAAEAPKKPLVPLVKAYDDLREALAEDKLDAARAAAAKLVDVAKADQPKLSEQADAAAKAADIAAARKAFGEVSRALLTAIQATPALGEGLIAFRCPMTETYQKWVQASRPLRNPYMGQEMLECGSKATLEP